MRDEKLVDDPVRPIIIQELCTACGDCVEVCPHRALSLVRGVVVMDRTVECEYCGTCEQVCPTEAIQRPFVVIFEQPAA